MTKFIVILTTMSSLMGSVLFAGEKKQRLKDNAYVTLTGKVGKIKGNDEFELIYGNAKNIIMVDTNDTWPALFEQKVGLFLKKGDRVTVYGKVDDHLFANKEIDASCITLHGKDYYMTYHNDPDHLSDDYLTWTYYYYPFVEMGYDKKEMEDGKYVYLSGTIKEIQEKDEFILQYGNKKKLIKVNTAELDFKGSDALKQGERITVAGEIDEAWFKGKELKANYLKKSVSYFSKK